MKKQLSLIMAGGLLALASCNSGNTPENGASQATIDSMVNARVEQIRIEMEAKNDSIINAMAQMKADSMIAAMKGGSSAKPVAKAKPGKPVMHAAENAPANVQPAAPVNPKESRFSGQPASTTKKDARFSEDAAKQQQAENAKKKADRFK